MKISNTTKNRTGEQGFSYVDVIIAIMICSIGILAMTAALTSNLIRAYGMTTQIAAKQVATSTLESVFSAREVQKPDSVGGFLEGWDSVGNVGTNPVDSVPQGVFLTGWNPVREKNGSDGVAGTIDDACAAANTDCPGQTTPNPIVKGLERRIVITDEADPTFTTIRKRKVAITVRYRISNFLREETITSLITDYQ
jgi:Tfp pilus assembly protein PilV